MTFLAMIIALLLMQAWGSATRLHHDDWFDVFWRRLEEFSIPPGVMLAAAILLPAGLVLVLLGVLEEILFGLPWIAFAVVLLLYSFGRRDFHSLLDRYRNQARHEDFEGAYLTTFAELGWAGPEDNPGSPQEVHSLVQRGFLYEGYQRWFAVLFFFVLLGPAGALAYRLLQLSREQDAAGLADRCLFVADWVPSRLLAATFSLTGDFVGSRDQLLQALGDLQRSAHDVLQSVGVASMGFGRQGAASEAGLGGLAEKQLDETASLLYRSAVCWVVVIALLVLMT